MSLHIYDPKAPQHGWPAEPDRDPPTVEHAEGRVLFAFAFVVAAMMLVITGVLLWMAGQDVPQAWGGK
jgi:cytochrome b subunit of formate dehydrogenase